MLGSALTFLQDSFALPAVVSLLIAACFSGFVTSFLVTPIERVKVLLQSSSVYKNELDCIQNVIAKEGVVGIFSREPCPTLAREVPSHGIYFLIYGLFDTASVSASRYYLVRGTAWQSRSTRFWGMTGMARDSRVPDIQ